MYGFYYGEESRNEWQLAIDGVRLPSFNGDLSTRNAIYQHFNEALSFTDVYVVKII